MTDTYKVLGQALTGDLALDGTTVKETVVYQVPAGTKASVSAIEITNSDVASQTYKVSFVKADEVSTAVVNAPYDVEIPGFVAVPDSTTNKAAYSTDGITWTDGNVIGFSLDSVAYGNGKFVVASFGSNESAYSTNGITWTQTTLPSSQNWSGITYGNEKFVIVANNSDQAAYSTDGINWTASTLPSSSSWRHVAYGNNRFVVVCTSSSESAYSTDGITWTATSTGYASFDNLVYGNDKFVALLYESSNALYSTDGITWTQINMPSNARWYGLTYGNGKFVAIVPFSDKTAYSTNGINWTAATMPISEVWTDVAYENNKFVALANGSSTSAYSTDGITWQLSTTNSNLFDLTSGILSITLQESTPQSSNKHIAIYNKSIASGETHEIKGGVTLSAGDQIRVYSTSNEIITNVYGVEIT
jgi:uncharacterized protein (DUF697 family)